MSIVDGDTVDVIPAGSGRTIRVRLHGIDAPERGEPFSTLATRAARVLLFDQRAAVDPRDVDRYGRLVARLVVRGEDASVSLLRSGLACHYVAYSSDAALAKAEAEARAAGRGFWATGAARPRCAAATTEAASPPGVQRSAVVFHGNTSSRVYHAPSCRNYRCRNCTREFLSEEAARAAGFRPAGDCLAGSPRPRWQLDFPRVTTSARELPDVSGVTCSAAPADTPIRSGDKPPHRFGSARDGWRGADTPDRTVGTR